MATEVFFTQGEQLVGVTRPSETVADAVGALLRGPTVAETRAGVRSHVPPDVRLRSVETSRGVATVDLGARFGGGKDDDALSARLAQLVSTVTAVPGVRAARVLLNGNEPDGVFPGVETTRPITRALLKRGTEPPRSLARHERVAVSAATQALQQRLVDLGFLRAQGVDGIAGEETRFGVIAFQKWAKLRRDGVVTAATQQALDRAVRPKPRGRSAGKRVEVLLDRQLALLVNGGVVVRTIHVSTGKPSTPTPAGSYAVFRKERRSWSVPFRVWLPWASYFVGGIAFHEYPDVPVRAASHGCVRVPRYDSELVFGFASRGTPVKVIATS